MTDLKKYLKDLNPMILSGKSAIYQSSESCDCDACAGCDACHGGCDSGCDCYY